MKRILLLSLILLLATLASAVDSPEVSALRRQAASEFSSGRYEHASELYARAVSLDPKDPDLRNQLLQALSYAKRNEDTATLQHQAAIEFRNGRFSQAADLYAGAAVQTPDDPALLEDWMWALWTAKRYEETVKVAAQVLALEKGNREALTLQVRALYYAGHTQEAYELDLSSHAATDGKIPLRRSMVHVYENLREYDKAVKLCEDLLKAQPKDAGLFATIGRARFYQGRYEEALGAWRKAVELDPHDVKSKIFKAKSLYFTGHASEAVELLKEIVRADPKNWLAAGFLVDVSSITKHPQDAVTVLENGLKNPTQEDEPRFLQLVEYYESLNQDDKALTTLDRAIAFNPNSGEALFEKANFLFSRGKMKDAILVYQSIVHQNPSAIDAWNGLADALTASSQTAKAIEVLQEARKIDLTDPYLLLKLAQCLYDSGDQVGGKRLIFDWMKTNTDERILPILLYHGLSTLPNDPMLASSIHVTADRFASHMRALKEAGFQAITTQQAADWFLGKADLPQKAVLVTFDDDRIDSFHYADPILKEYGFKAAMMTPIFNIESNSPGFASWNMISSYTTSGRWEIQAHGDQAHNLIKMDKEGHLRLFLTHKRWIDEQGRLETLDEWQERVQADHESAKTKIRAHLGTTPVAFAYPEGDYGQVGTPNFPQSATLNRHSLCIQSFSICFTQDEHGLNVRSRESTLIDRMEPRQDWTPQHLLRLISDQNPFAAMRQQLLLWDAWEGHPRAAYHWLELNRAAGVSQPALAASEAQIRFATGDQSRGLELASLALTLDPSAENQRLVDSMTRTLHHDWAPSISFFRDSQTRENLLFEQSVGSLEYRGIFMRALHGVSMYRENGVNTVIDNNLGIELKRTMGIGHTLVLQSAGHVLSGQGQSAISVYGNFSSDWTDLIQTEVRAGRDPYGYARALDAHISDQYLDLKGALGSEETGKAETELRLADPTDNNRRASFELSGLWPFALNDEIRAVGRFTADDTRFVSPNYYSPQHLYMNQVGLGYLAHFKDSFKVDLSYMPGFGTEVGAPYSFVQDAELILQWTWRQKLQLRPSISVTSTPSYNSKTYSLLAVYQF
jgi:tetratricopeptide (TPR) repeat protein